MATRLQKLLITLICGTALGVTRCHTPEVENAPGPPPDMAADAGADGDEADGIMVAPEPVTMPAYGVAPDPKPYPETPDQPMYGVPME